jgi:hypothetical protein
VPHQAVRLGFVYSPRDDLLDKPRWIKTNPLSSQLWLFSHQWRKGVVLVEHVPNGEILWDHPVLNCERELPIWPLAIFPNRKC